MNTLRSLPPSHWTWSLRRRVGVAAAMALLLGCADETAPPGPDSGAATDAGVADGAGSGLDATGLDATGFDATGLDATGLDATGIDRPDGAVMGSDGAVAPGDAGVQVDGGTGSWDGGACVPVVCGGGRPLACADCVDNDGDGRIDAQDPECLGPCDNTEGPVLLAGVGGETGGPCRADCYFDFGNGAGNDDCRWDHRCDPRAVAPDYPPEGPMCAYDAARVGSRECPASQSQQCLDRCLPITPNGCDCFGCCTFPALAGRGPGGGPGYVWLGSRNPDGTGSCTLDRVTDPNACRACTPVRDCLNTCELCEVCIGRPAPDPRCFGTPTDAGVSGGDGGAPGTDAGPRPDGSAGGTDSGIRPDGEVPGTDAGPRPDSGTSTGQCLAGVQPCGLPGQAPCATNYYCITGCCIAAPP
jgi:hypothetical protein